MTHRASGVSLGEGVDPMPDAQLALRAQRHHSVGHDACGSEGAQPLR